MYGMDFGLSQPQGKKPRQGKKQQPLDLLAFFEGMDKAEGSPGMEAGLQAQLRQFMDQLGPMSVFPARGGTPAPAPLYDAVMGRPTL